MRGLFTVLASVVLGLALSACGLIGGLQDFSKGACPGGACDGSVDAPGADAQADAGGGCRIGGAVVKPMAPNPSNACEVCSPGESRSAWSHQSDGTACGADQVCHAGACTMGCEIGGVFYAPSASKPGDPCQSCQPATSRSAWTNRAEGAACGNGQVCSAGQCGAKCDIGGVLYASAAPNPKSGCQSCQPGKRLELRR